MEQMKLLEKMYETNDNTYSFQEIIDVFVGTVNVCEKQSSSFKSCKAKLNAQEYNGLMNTLLMSFAMSLASKGMSVDEAIEMTKDTEGCKCVAVMKEKEKYLA